MGVCLLCRHNECRPCKILTSLAYPEISFEWNTILCAPLQDAEDSFLEGADMAWPVRWIGMVCGG